jgi:hypothetical protein
MWIMGGLALYGAVTGTLGTLAGVAALIISILAYRRDVGSLKVTLLRNTVRGLLYISCARKKVLNRVHRLGSCKRAAKLY